MAIAGSALAAVRVASPVRAVDTVALRRAEALAAPDALAATKTLPLLAPLASLVPGGALQRGTTLGVEGVGATSLALAVAAGASAAGSWLAAAGVADLGLAAAAELGIHLGRLLVVAEPPADSWATVVAALLDAVDVVLVAPLGRLGLTDARRLQARARERGAVLCALGGRWPLPVDVRLTVARTSWTGATGAGSGRFEARRVEVVGGGRGAAARERRAELWLPGPDGALAEAAPASTPVSLDGPAPLAAVS